LATALLVELAELELLDLLELDAEDESEDFELLPHPTTVNPTTASAAALTAITDFFTRHAPLALINGQLHSRPVPDLVEDHGDVIGTLGRVDSRLTPEREHSQTSHSLREASARPSLVKRRQSCTWS
jgi:hypothetical protein